MSTIADRKTECATTAAPETVVLEACPACGGRNFAVLATPYRWIGGEVFGSLRGKIGLCRCRSCGLRFTNPRPGPDLLDAFYSGENYCCHSLIDGIETRKKAESTLDRIEAVLPSGGQRRLLDYGCGGGGFLKSASQRGWEPHGFEPGRRGHEVCLEAGLDVTRSVDDLPAQQFDLITLHHVFEHIPDPVGALAGIGNLLAENGRLYVEVPNVQSLRARLSPQACSTYLRFDERHRAFPIHLWYFSAKTIARLFDRAGFELEHVFSCDLGIDQLIILESSAPAAPANGATREEAASPSDRPSKKKLKGLRTAVKKSIVQSGLGENLGVIARPRR